MGIPKELLLVRHDPQVQIIRRAILEESFETIREAVVAAKVNSLPEKLRQKLYDTFAELGLSREEGMTYTKEVFEIMRTFTTFMVAEMSKTA